MSSRLGSHGLPARPGGGRPQEGAPCKSLTPRATATAARSGPLSRDSGSQRTYPRPEVRGERSEPEVPAPGEVPPPTIRAVVWGGVKEGVCGEALLSKFRKSHHCLPSSLPAAVLTFAS